jgi:hypothetical protein
MTKPLGTNKHFAVIRRAVCAVLPGFLLYMVSEAKAEDITLGSFDFEDASLAGWEGGGGFASVSTENPASGKRCLLLELNGKEEGLVFRRFILPQEKDLTARMVKISFSVRGENFTSGSATIGLLKNFDFGRNPEWFEWDKPVFATVTTKKEWTRFSGEGFFGPEVRSITFYFNMGNKSKMGKVFIDNLRVDLLDRGLRLNLGWKDYIFSEESKRVDLIISSPEKLKSGHVTILNEENEKLGQTCLSRGRSHHEVLLATRGYFLVLATAEYDDGVKVETSSPLAVVGLRIPEETRLKSRFGMSGDGDTQFIDAGARWDRRRGGLDGDVFEEASKTDFQKPLPHPLCEVSRDRTSIYYLWPQPVWLQDRNVLSIPKAVTPVDMYPIKDWEKFRKLVSFAVRNMSSEPLEYVEVANEPDMFWKGPWSGLVRYHKEIAHAVKSVSPTTKIIGPCLCNISIKELKELYSLGLFECLDGLSIHAYVKSTPPENEFIHLIQDLKVFLKSIRKEEIPIFITEYGWPVPPGDWQKPVDPLTQARYCSRSMILLAAEQIDAVQWFCLRWADPASSAYGYGLLNWDWTPRSSYPAYACATRCLANTTGPGRVFRTTPTGYMALFNRTGNTLAAVWDTEKKSRMFLPEPWKEALGMMGRPVKELNTPAIEASLSPSYVMMPGLDFYSLKEYGTQDVGPGEAVSLPFVPAWTPAPLIAENNRVRIPADAENGPYLLIGKIQDHWTSVTVRVLQR